MPKQGKGRLRVAIAQLPISGNVVQNAAKIRAAMREAAGGRARLIQFPIRNQGRRKSGLGENRSE